MQSEVHRAGMGSGGAAHALAKPGTDSMLVLEALVTVHETRLAWTTGASVLPACMHSVSC